MDSNLHDWKRKEIRSLGRILEKNGNYFNYCYDNGIGYTEATLMVELIKEYGVDEAIRLNEFDTDDLFEKPRKKRRARSEISKIDRRAKAIGMSYGHYVASNQYKDDVRSGKIR